MTSLMRFVARVWGLDRTSATETCEVRMKLMVNRIVRLGGGTRILHQEFYVFMRLSIYYL